jgi:hypothetical protein
LSGSFSRLAIKVEDSILKVPWRSTSYMLPFP